MDVLARSLSRGQVVGSELCVATALASQVRPHVRVELRRDAAGRIATVLNATYHCSHECFDRPGGFLAQYESIRSGARVAMRACIGDVHTVDALVQVEPDSLVCEHMQRWYPRVL